MPVRSDTNEYALGSDTAEQERLVRQAAWLANHTESFFRRAGIGPGHCVLRDGHAFLDSFRGRDKWNSAGYAAAASG